MAAWSSTTASFLASVRHLRSCAAVSSSTELNPLATSSMSPTAATSVLAASIRRAANPDSVAPSIRTTCSTGAAADCSAGAGSSSWIGSPTTATMVLTPSGGYFVIPLIVHQFES